MKKANKKGIFCRSVYNVFRKIKWTVCILLFLTIIGTAGLMAVSAQYLNNYEHHVKITEEENTPNIKSLIYSSPKVHPTEPVRTEKDTIEGCTEIGGNKNIETVSENIPAADSEAESVSDTVYIGDSRTEGFILNSGLTDVKAFTSIGMTVDSVFSKPVINMNGNIVTVIGALKQTDFNKVYIMLGINETGWAYDSVFIEKYKELIDEIQEINPNADIYIQSILPVSQNVSDTHKYINNDKIEHYNELIQNLAQEENVHYLNVAEVMKDENGALPDEAAPDGIHLKKEYCLKWLDYIKNNS